MLISSLQIREKMKNAISKSQNCHFFKAQNFKMAGNSITLYLGISNVKILNLQI